MPADAFAPFEDLYHCLSAAIESSGDGSHDLSHLERVWRNARQIASEEGGSLRQLAAAVMLHDCVTVEKSSKLRGQASRLSAQRAAEMLQRLGWDAPEIAVVTDAIEAHSYSAGLTPKTLEGRILQDADRLDAIGMVGVARCFYTAGRMGSRLYEPLDPRGRGRALDDTRYALDHFPMKLLRVAEGFQTQAGARLAQVKQARLLAFYDMFAEEVEGSVE